MASSVAHPLDSDACPHRAGVAESPCERASIDALYPGHSMPKEKVMKISLRAPVTGKRAQLFDDEAAHLWRFTLDVEQVGAIISDEWISHRDDLASVGGIGKHLLVAGHCRIEADFARLRPRRTKRLAAKNRSVFKCQHCIHTRMIDARTPCSNGNGASCDSGKFRPPWSQKNGLLFSEAGLGGYCPACAVSTHIPFPVQGWMTAARRADFQ